MPEYLIPVTLHHTILVPYDVDPYDGEGLAQALEMAKEDGDLHEVFPTVERQWDPSCSVEGWWDVDTDLDYALVAYESCPDGRKALARGLMALMMQ